MYEECSAIVAVPNVYTYRLNAQTYKIQSFFSPYKIIRELKWVHGSESHWNIELLNWSRNTGILRFK
jgi:hypothetical protein